jgi:BirA family transcriptional regulator, biotin operon repressor / biotin---[acetyl-CoA-carboxylase] ligase
VDKLAGEKGYTYRALDLKEIRNQLHTRFFANGDRLVFVPIIDSTNIRAMQLARMRAEEGTVVLTDSQTAGKGRLGRRWVDVSGCNVLSSTVLRPNFPPYLLVMLASLAVVDAISETCDVVATIKWPNDVLVGNRKVAGILIETSHDHNGQLIAIMGIGVNVNGYPLQRSADEVETSQDEHLPGAQATTLETESGHTISREALIANLLQHIESSYLALQQEAQESVATAQGSISRLVREQWRNQLSTLGRPIQVRQGNMLFSGVAEDVNDDGELLLRDHSGNRVTISWGDIGYPTT